MEKIYIYFFDFGKDTDLCGEIFGLVITVVLDDIRKGHSVLQRNDVRKIR